jgi:uncharacterized membrane protein
MPKSIKYSLSVDNYSTLVMTVQSAPVDILQMIADKTGREFPASYTELSQYHLDNSLEGETLDLFKQVFVAMNTDNHNRSDVMSDYFDVGHYVYVKIGSWNKPFKVSIK